MRSDLFQHEMTGTSSVFGRKRGVQVEFDDKGARTDGQTIYLPALPSGYEVSEETLDVMRGYVDHEAGHLRHTDMKTGNKYLKRWQEEGNKLAVSLLQGLEDVRLERKVIAEYPGALKNLRAVTKRVNQETMDAVKSGRITVEQLASAEAAAGIAMTWRGRLDYGEETSGQLLGMLERENPALFGQLDGWYARLMECRKTGDVCKLVQEIIGEIEEGLPEPEEQEPEEQEQTLGGDEEEQEEQSTDERESEGEDGESGESGEDDGGEPDAGEGDESGEGDGEGEGSDGEGDGDDGKGDGSEGDGDGDGDGGEEESDADSGMSGGGKAGKAGSGTKASDAEVIETPDVKGAVERALKEEGVADVRSHTHYKIATTKRDWYPHAKMTSCPNGVSLSRYSHWMNILRGGSASRYLDRVRQMSGDVNVMRRALERSLLAKAERDWQRNQESGKLDSRRFVAAVAGRKDVRKRRDESRELDTAVQVVIDLSGSMYRDDKIEVARDCAIAICEAVGRTGVALEVIGFNSDWETRVDRSAEGRIEPLEMPLFKAFEDKLNDARGALYQIGVSADANNADGEAIMAAYARLAKRSEQRKVMMVLSDGAPAFKYNGAGEPFINQHTRDAVDYVERQGVDCIGVGIMTNSVERFYPKAVRVDDVGQLAKVAMGQLGSLLLGKTLRGSTGVAGASPRLMRATPVGAGEGSRHVRGRLVGGMTR